MKKQTILLSALALTMLASCEKEVVNAPTGVKKSQISLILGEYGETKGIGAFTPTGSQVAVGLNFNVESFDATPTSLGDAKMDFIRTGTTNVYTASADVNTAATKVKLTGNYDGLKVDGVTLTSNVNTRQGDVTKPVVLVSGEGAIFGAPDARKADVNVVPEMARIEIVGANSGASFTNIKSVKVKAIYLNNVKLVRDPIGGSETALSNTTGTANFGVHYGVGGIKEKLVDNNSGNGWEIVDASSARVANVFGAGNAVGYNIFPQSGGSNTELHPHINIEVSYQESLDGGTTFNTKEGFINIKAFQIAPSVYVQSFTAGNVYTFSVSDITDIIIDPDIPITPEPEPEVGGVIITCTIKEWTVVPVTPEV